MDLVFILDSSSSVSLPNFKSMKAFVGDVVAPLDISETGSRVGCIMYGTSAEIRFLPNAYYDKATLQQAIRDLPESPSGLTNTGGALQLAKDYVYLASAGSRLYDLRTPQFLVLLTDGMANIGPQPERVASSIQATGVEIVTIGVNVGKVDELNAIASDPDNEHVFLITNFGDLRDILFNISTLACNANFNTTRPPTWGAWSAWTDCSISCGGGRRMRERLCVSPKPNTTVTLENCTSLAGNYTEGEGCSNTVCPSKECQKPVDILFLLDSSRYVTSDDLAIQLNFTMTVVSFFGVLRSQAQVGLIKYGTYPNVEFDLLRYPTDKAARDGVRAVSTYTGSERNIAAALRMARRRVLIVEKGARVNMTNVAQVIVLITSGDSTTISATNDVSLSKTMGHQLVVIGVGNTYERKFNDFLIATASGSQLVGRVSSFAELDTLKNWATHRVCHQAPANPRHYFSSWGSWGSCSASCGPNGGTTRVRSCNCLSSTTLCGSTASGPSVSCVDTDLSTERLSCYGGICPPHDPIYLGAGCPMGAVFTWQAFAGLKYSLYINGSILSDSCNSTALGSCSIFSLESSLTYGCRLQACDSVSCAWSNLAYFTTGTVYSSIFGQSFISFFSVSYFAAAGIYIRSEASGPYGCIVQLEADQNALSYASSYNVEFVCYVVDSFNGTAVQSIALNLANATLINHLDPDTTYTFQLFARVGSTFYELAVNTPNATRNGTTTITTGSVTSPIVLGAVELSQDGHNVLVSWFYFRRFILTESDGVYYHIYQNGIKIFTTLSFGNLTHTIYNASTVSDVYRITCCSTVSCTEGFISIKTTPPRFPKFWVTIRGTVLSWLRSHYHTFSLMFNGSAIEPGCFNVTSDSCVANTLAAYTTYTIVLKACYYTVCSESMVTVLRTGPAAITTVNISAAANGGVPVPGLNVFNLPFPPVLEAAAVGADTILCNMALGASLQNSNDGAGEKGFDVASFRLFVVSTNGTVARDLYIQPDKLLTITGLGPTTTYNLELYVIIANIWYLVPGPVPKPPAIYSDLYGVATPDNLKPLLPGYGGGLDPTGVYTLPGDPSTCVPTTQIVTLGSSFPTILSRPTFTRNPITFVVTIYWTVPELSSGSYPAGTKFYVVCDGAVIRTVSTTNILSITDSPGPGFYVYTVIVCYLNSCTRSGQEATSPSPPTTTSTPLGVLIDLKKTADCHCTSTVLVNGTVLDSCKNLEKDVCVVSFIELGLDPLRPHNLSVTTRECSVIKGCADSEPRILTTAAAPAPGSTGGIDVHKVFVSGGIVFATATTNTFISSSAGAGSGTTTSTTTPSTSTTTSTSYGIITGSTTYAGGTGTAPTRSPTASGSSGTGTTTVATAAETVLLGGTILQIGGSTLDTSQPMLQLNRTTVEAAGHVVRDLINFGMPVLQVSSSSSRTAEVTITTSVLAGECSCIMQTPGRPLPSGLNDLQYVIAVHFVGNGSLAYYTTLLPGKSTTITGLEPESNYDIKFFVQYRNLWFQILTNGVDSNGYPASTPPGTTVAPGTTPAPGSPASPNILSTPKKGAPAGVAPPVVIRDPTNPDLILVRFTVPNIVASNPEDVASSSGADPTLTAGTTLAPSNVIPGETTLAPAVTATTPYGGGGVTTNAPITEAPGSGVNSKPLVYKILRNGKPLQEGTSLGGNITLSIPFPSDENLPAGDIFQLVVCNDIDCTASLMTVAPPIVLSNPVDENGNLVDANGNPIGTGAGGATDPTATAGPTIAPLPTVPSPPTIKTTPHGVVLLWDKVPDNKYTILINDRVVRTCENLATSECLLVGVTPGTDVKIDIWATTKVNSVSGNPTTIAIPPAIGMTPTILHIFVTPMGPEARPAPIPPRTYPTGVTPVPTTPPAAGAVTTSSSQGGQPGGGGSLEPDRTRTSPTKLPGNIVRLGGRCLSATEQPTYMVPANASLPSRLAGVTRPVRTAADPLLSDLMKGDVPEITLAPHSPTGVTVTMATPVNTTEPPTSVQYYVFFERNLTKTPDRTGGTVGGPSDGTTTSSPGSGDVTEVKSFRLYPPQATDCSNLSPDVVYEVKIYVVKIASPSDIWIRIQLPDQVLPGGLYPTTTTPVETQPGGQPVTTSAMVATTAPGSAGQQCSSGAMSDACGFIPSGPIRVTTPKSGSPVNVPKPGVERPRQSDPKVRVTCTVPARPTQPEDLLLGRLPGARPREQDTALTTAPPVGPTTPPGQDDRPTYIIYRDGTPICSGEGPGTVVVDDCCDQFSYQPVYSLLVCYGDRCSSSPSQSAPPKTLVPTTDVTVGAQAGSGGDGSSAGRKTCNELGMSGMNWAIIAIVAMAIAVIAVVALVIVIVLKPKGASPAEEDIEIEPLDIPTPREEPKLSRWGEYIRASMAQYHDDLAEKGLEADEDLEVIDASK